MERTLEALDRSAALGAGEGLGGPVSVTLGDASPERVLTDEHLAALRGRFTALAALDYEFFDENTGTAKGHNRLAARRRRARSSSPAIPTSSPTGAPCRACSRCSTTPATGMVEAKQSRSSTPRSTTPDR